MESINTQASFQFVLPHLHLSLVPLLTMHGRDAKITARMQECNIKFNITQSASFYRDKSAKLRVASFRQGSRDVNFCHVVISLAFCVQTFTHLSGFCVQRDMSAPECADCTCVVSRNQFNSNQNCNLALCNYQITKSWDLIVCVNT